MKFDPKYLLNNLLLPRILMLVLPPLTKTSTSQGSHGDYGGLCGKGDHGGRWLCNLPFL